LPTSALEQNTLTMEPREFKLFRALIHERTGIYLRDTKQVMLTARLQRRLRQLGLSNFEQYYDYLNSAQDNGEELVQFINEHGDFCVGVAGFPEGHIACKEGKYADWVHLNEKIKSGADFVVTQLFFDNSDYFEFRDHLARKHGVTVPLVPGIVPILSGSQIKRFTSMCGARVPASLAAKLDELGDHDDAVAQFGIEFATRQCEELLRAGASGIHFYTLNKAQSTVQVLKNLGLA